MYVCMYTDIWTHRFNPGYTWVPQKFYISNLTNTGWVCWENYPYHIYADCSLSFYIGQWTWWTSRCTGSGIPGSNKNFTFLIWRMQVGCVGKITLITSMQIAVSPFISYDEHEAHSRCTGSGIPGSNKLFTFPIWSLVSHEAHPGVFAVPIPVVLSVGALVHPQWPCTWTNKLETIFTYFGRSVGWLGYISYCTYSKSKMFR